MLLESFRRVEVAERSASARVGAVEVHAVGCLCADAKRLLVSRGDFRTIDPSLLTSQVVVTRAWKDVDEYCTSRCETLTEASVR